MSQSLFIKSIYRLLKKLEPTYSLSDSPKIFMINFKVLFWFYVSNSIPGGERRFFHIILVSWSLFLKHLLLTILIKTHVLYTIIRQIFE